MNTDNILIGWSNVDITPEIPAILVGQFHVRIAKSVNDPLTATALALEAENNGEQAIIVSIDGATIPDIVRDSCRHILKDKLNGFDSSKLFLSATHTHSACVSASLRYPAQAPEVLSTHDYIQFLIKRISETACKAWENRSSGGLSWGCGNAVVGHNRRATYFDGTAKMYGKTDDKDFSHIEGYEDHEVNLIFTYDGRNRLSGVLVNLARLRGFDTTLNFF